MNTEVPTRPPPSGLIAVLIAVLIISVSVLSGLVYGDKKKQREAAATNAANNSQIMEFRGDSKDWHLIRTLPYENGSVLYVFVDNLKEPGQVYNIVLSKSKLEELK